MREVVEVSVGMWSKDVFPGWQDLVNSYLMPLHPMSVEISPYGPAMKFVYGYYPGQYEDIQVILKNFKVDSHLWVHREYDPTELLQAQFLDLGTEFDVDSVVGTLKWNLLPVCEYCGFRETNWILPMIRIKNRSEGYQLAKVDYHPKVVSADLAGELLTAGFSGFELVPLGDDSSADWHALHVTHVLPPMKSPPTRLKRLPVATPLCKRNHNFGQTLSEFLYQRNGFDSKDFNRTYEIFGDSESTGRGLIVSNRVYRLLLKLGVKDIVCEPIRLLD